MASSWLLPELKFRMIGDEVALALALALPNRGVGAQPFALALALALAGGNSADAASIFTLMTFFEGFGLARPSPDISVAAALRFLVVVVVVVAFFAFLVAGLLRSSVSAVSFITCSVALSDICEVT